MNKSRIETRPAMVVIAAMKGLLAQRKKGNIKRKQFLEIWGKLRMLLSNTQEYFAWREIVKECAGGACEECAEVGAHAHHKIRVAEDPDQALNPDNGEFLCFRCHSKRPGHHMHRHHSRSHSDSRNPTGLRTRPDQQSRMARSTPDTPARLRAQEAKR
jgi:5-methylcytosine-specific restriction endonuclease McrA